LSNTSPNGWGCADEGAVDAAITFHKEIDMPTILDTWREKRAMRHTHQQLHQLSDRTLADIGLTRADIASVGADGRIHRRR
jgi:uncharacterized protein YjiS (DUF1127 family)